MNEAAGAGASNAGGLRVLVADDEPPARQRIVDLLAREPGVAAVDEAASGREAVAAITGPAVRRPDVVFLDVQMPGMDGVEVVRAVGPRVMPATVFVTAYDRYALRAFELAALDYLLKPFEDARFAEAFARAREAVRLRSVGALAGRLAALLGAPAADDGPPGAASGRPPGGTPNAPPAAPPNDPAGAGPYAERLAVEEDGGTVRVVPVERLDYVTAEGPYVRLHAGGEVHVLRESLAGLEARLDPARFARAHRSVLVRLDRVEALLHRGGGEYEVRLRGGVRLPVSRGRREQLARRLGVWG